MSRSLLVLAGACAFLFAQDVPAGGGRGRQGRGGAPRNLKILKAEEVRETMASFVAGTGLACDGCHVQGDRSSDEKKEKVVARRMLEMVRGINSTSFNGNNKVTCYTCHRGEEHPPSAPPVQ